MAMILPKVLKSVANQSITFERYLETDEFYKKPKYDKPVEINNCVVQQDTIYSGTNNNREIVANAVIFLYSGVTSPIPKLTKNDVRSKITFEGTTFVLKRIVDNRNPFSNDIWSYELEVL